MSRLMRPAFPCRHLSRNFPAVRIIIGYLFARCGPMTGSNQVEELVNRWRRHLRHGENITLEQLCQDCPELLAEVRRRLEAECRAEATLKDDRDGPAFCETDRAQTVRSEIPAIEAP